MKKFFVTAVLAVALVSASFAADIVKVNSRIQSAFHKEFVSAFNPTWESVGSGIFHVTFLQNGEVMDAYFNEDAELISFARYVSVEQLPLLINKSIQENFKGSTITQIQEMVVIDETSYIVTLEKDQKTIVARVFSTGGIQVIKKIKNVKTNH